MSNQHKKKHDPHGLTKLGSYVVSIETFTHSLFQHYVVWLQMPKSQFLAIFQVTPWHLIDHDFKHS